jgi:hypothetical protein
MALIDPGSMMCSRLLFVLAIRHFESRKMIKISWAFSQNELVTKFPFQTTLVIPAHAGNQASTAGKKT